MQCPKCQFQNEPGVKWCIECNAILPQQASPGDDNNQIPESQRPSAAQPWNNWSPDQLQNVPPIETAPRAQAENRPNRLPWLDDDDDLDQQPQTPATYQHFPDADTIASGSPASIQQPDDRFPAIDDERSPQDAGDYQERYPPQSDADYPYAPVPEEPYPAEQPRYQWNPDQFENAPPADMSAPASAPEQSNNAFWTERSDERNQPPAAFDAYHQAPEADRVVSDADAFNQPPGDKLATMDESYQQHQSSASAQPPADHARSGERCYNCQEALPDFGSFCPYCGLPVIQDELQQCRICHTGLVPGAKYCYECGAAQTAMHEPEPAQVQPPPQSQPPWQPAAPPQPQPAPQQVRQPILRLTMVNSPGTYFPLSDHHRTYTVGRNSPGYPVEIDLKPYEGQKYGVSRVHARIFYENGQWLVEDSSQYGTFINDQQIPGQTAVALRHGCFVKFGGIQFQVSEE